MANFLEKVNYSTMSMPKAMNRTNPAPLDASAIWTSLEDLRDYAATSAVAYIGQILSLVDYNAETGEIAEVKAYIIKDAEGNIEEVGSATLGDDHSIELVDGVLSIKGFGKRYYKYVAENGDVAAHYEAVDVDAEHPWIAGLEPRIVNEDGELVIGWYEPNPTTIEGVQDQVVAAQGDIAQAKQDIADIEDNIDEVEENLAKAEEKIDSINDVLYGTEGEEAVEGLVDKVAGLEEDVSDLQDAVANVYTKEQVDGLVSGVFHFKGEKDSYDDLPSALNNKAGDVWQVGEKEYAWNGEGWVELGFNVDLTDYATKAYADTIAENAQKAVTAHETAVNAKIAEVEQSITDVAGDVSKNAEAIAQNAKDIAATVEDLGDLMDALDQLESNNSTVFETINGSLDALAQKDTGFETRIGALETSLGTPSDTFVGSLFPAVETLHEQIKGFTAVGGEANLINGITINGQKLNADATSKLVDLPVFNGTNIGLVPNVGEDTLDNFLLTASGIWANPIGDLGDFATVVEYIDNAIEDVRLVWETIS